MKQILPLLFFSALVVLQTSSAEARKRYRARSCANPQIATTSIYFTPNMKDYCKGRVPCAPFMKVVRDAGSGKIPGNRLITFQRKIVPLKKCETAFGFSGKCLTPYISVAADLRKHNLGDIIEMPGLKGKKIRLPNGKIMVHPGYFIVEDRGGGVKGAGRFDVYTGSHGLKSNVFGLGAPLPMRFAAKEVCSPVKKFAVIRLGSDKYKRTMVAINEARYGPTSEPKNYMAAMSEGIDPARGNQ